jgi:hypothetical protein
MIEGILTINLDPPYLSFHPNDSTSSACLRECATADIYVALGELAPLLNSVHQLDDCVVRLQGNFSKGRLSKLGLLRGHLESLSSRLSIQLAN